MLDLAAFRGLAPGAVSSLPRVAYFHENQLTYPDAQKSERDHHFAFTNITTALAASRTWFNSRFHQRDFLSAAASFLRRMPADVDTGLVDAIAARSEVRPPCVTGRPPRAARGGRPAHVLWVGRWERDKRPDLFFAALDRVAQLQPKPFVISVIGGSPEGTTLPCFGEAAAAWRGRIRRWGYQPSRAEYESALAEADIVVSTAEHEFFGIAVLEAVEAGAFPLLPRRLAYPEILGGGEAPGRESWFYEDPAEELPRRLGALIDRCHDGSLWQGDPERARRESGRFHWEAHVPGWDAELERLARRGA
jgi:glycosyltransferase involved in cell wall biosynthesis